MNKLSTDFTRLNPTLVERLAEIAHDAWRAESERQKRASPYHVPYAQLSDDVKELDRVVVRHLLWAIWMHLNAQFRALRGGMSPRAALYFRAAVGLFKAD